MRLRAQMRLAAVVDRRGLEEWRWFFILELLKHGRVPNLFGLASEEGEHMMFGPCERDAFS
jgi:hypothetical protein